MCTGAKVQTSTDKHTKAQISTLRDPLCAGTSLRMSPRLPKLVVFEGFLKLLFVENAFQVWFGTAGCLADAGEARSEHVLHVGVAMMPRH